MGRLHRRLAGLGAEEHDLGDRVATETVRTVHRDAAAFAGGVQSVDGRAARLVIDHVDAAHHVVVRRADGHGLFDHVDALEVHGELAHLRKALEDLLGPEVAQIDEHVALHALAEPAPFLDLRLD